VQKVSNRFTKSFKKGKSPLIRGKLACEKGDFCIFLYEFIVFAQTLKHGVDTYIGSKRACSLDVSMQIFLFAQDDNLFFM